MRQKVEASNRQIRQSWEEVVYAGNLETEAGNLFMQEC